VILAGDVGATKILLEAGDFRSDAWKPVIQRRYLIADFDNFGAVIARFLEEWDAVKPPRARLTAAAIGAAGPLQGDTITMTHRAWKIASDTIIRRFGIPKARVMNDLAAAAHGLGSMTAREVITLQPGKAAPTEPRVLLGVGTGLGVAYLVPTNKSPPTPFMVVPGEGGHVGFSPASAEQAALWQWMFRQHGRVEAEQLCSGMGLVNIYEFLQGRGECAATPERRDPAWILQNAAENKEPACINALDLFAECLGNVAADHALAVMARGGVYLAGGVIAKLAPSFNIEKFRSAFAAKSLFSAQLMKIPVKLVSNERIALIGAARVAESL
jgi:glucokinase